MSKLEDLIKREFLLFEYEFAFEWIDYDGNVEMIVFSEYLADFGEELYLKIEQELEK